MLLTICYSHCRTWRGCGINDGVCASRENVSCSNGKCCSNARRVLVQAWDVLQVPGKRPGYSVARVVLHRYKASQLTYTQVLSFPAC